MTPFPAFTGVWLLWVGVGAGASLSSLGYHWIYSQAATILCFSIYGFFNLDPKKVLRSIFFTVLSIFFRDFDVAGTVRVPLEGPIILACAPHANQFVDGLVVLQSVQQREDIGMLTAAVTMRRKFVGALARIMGGVPVERPQDLAVAGDGKITIEASKVCGHGGTRFLEQVKIKDSIVLTSGPNTKTSVRVASVENNSELTISTPVTEDVSSKSSFKVVPYIDQSDVFTNVQKQLDTGGVIMIFPEGGSHDRTRLLPLKHGVGQMALESFANHDLEVPIVPVGINYFKGHRFRSRVFVEIGNPIYPTGQMKEDFLAGGVAKRAAVGSLMDKVKDGLNSVTVQSDDFESLQFCRFMRRVYPSSQIANPDPTTRFKLVQAFTKGYEKDKEDERVVDLKVRCLDYMRLLKSFNVSDHHIAVGSDGANAFAVDFEVLLWNILQLILFSLCSLPGMLLAAPLMFITRQVSAREARKALRKSSVKVAGRDVIATWKLMVSFVVTPILHLLYAIIIGQVLGTSLATVYFFFGPVLFSVAIVASERSEQLIQTVRLSWLAYGDPSTGRRLARTRRDLQKEVRSLTKELGWDSSLDSIEATKHLYRKFSTPNHKSSFQSSNSIENDDWELDDAFFQNPRNRGLSEYSS